MTDRARRRAGRARGSGRWSRLRMSRVSVPLLVAGSAWVAGCRMPGGIDLGGRSGLATGALYRHAESIVLARDHEADPKCRQRKVLDTRLIEAPEAEADPRGGHESFSFSGSGTPSSYVVPPERRYSRFVERWAIQRCDSEVFYRVTYTPGASGTDVVAELESTPPPP